MERHARACRWAQMPQFPQLTSARRPEAAASGRVSPKRFSRPIMADRAITRSNFKREAGVRRGVQGVVSYTWAHRSTTDRGIPERTGCFRVSARIRTVGARTSMCVTTFRLLVVPCLKVGCERHFPRPYGLPIDVMIRRQCVWTRVRQSAARRGRRSLDRRSGCSRRPQVGSRRRFVTTGTGQGT